MSRILTGIQSSGIPHLGNILGAIQPAIELSESSENESLFFIADLHALTSIRDAETLKNNTLATAAAWLAFGLDTDKVIFYRQSDIKEVCELAWFLNCFTPIPMLENAHSFKDKSQKFSKDKISAGLFTYPVLMAADILLFDSEKVPVGKDQIQHLEITRDIAGAFNHQYGETFVLPETLVKEDVKIVPGTDGQKMSKSYDNFINIFLPDKKLRKVVMSIVTDSTPLEEPKDPDTCNVFKLFRLLGSDAQISEMRSNYKGGNYGYGHAKQALFELIISKFAQEREKYNELMNQPQVVEKALLDGSKKASEISKQVLRRVKDKIGF